MPRIIGHRKERERGERERERERERATITDIRLLRMHAVEIGEVSNAEETD